ncbi:hypothetical protein B0T16DRAFT_457705 [Cercophora newfieldiana]|uniref:Zn(2)-C6 fungal-type domain-containing protein n=1 Tax=Cercophora newfieldiana TaxID=92897 RepID=A0AA39Y459_9PEZI|nr:hypothetical protein B0T16DRAFT_457705 [Cercophora newfieldiana]
MEHPGRRVSRCRDADDPACASSELLWDPSFCFVSSSDVPGPIVFAPSASQQAAAAVVHQQLAGSSIAASHNHGHSHLDSDAAAARSWAAEHVIAQNAAYLGLPPSQRQWIGPPPSPSTAAPRPAGPASWALASAVASPVTASYGPVLDSAQHSVEGQLIFPFGHPFDTSVALDVPLISWSDEDLAASTFHPDVPASPTIPVDDSSSTLSTISASRPPSASPSAPFINEFGPPRRASVQHQKKRKLKSPPPTLEIIHFRPDGSTTEDRSRKRRAKDSEAGIAGSPRTLKKVTYEDENGEMRGAMMTFGNPEHHRSRFTPEKRQETKLARREGVCSRCQGSKRKCDLALKESLYVPCTRCSTSKLYKNVSPMPCFKSVLKEVMFFRDGPAANEPFFTERFKRLTIEDISKPNVPVRNLQLTQGVGHKLMIYASEFVPLPGDKVSLTWKDPRGNEREMRMPPFCLTNMQKVTAQVRQYIYVAKQSYLESYAMSSNDELVANTVRMAMEYAKIKSGSLVSIALDLWAVSRMIEIEWEMCGPDTLGVHRINDMTNPRNGKIPIPPMMDTQLDQIVIREVLYPLKKKFLDEFEARISPLRAEDWFDIYLASFIVLNHIERLALHSAYHARLHSMPTKFSNVPFLTNVFHTAKVILSRFHFVCNGSAPLAIDWDSPSALAMAKLDTKQITFMKETQALIKARETDIVSLRTSYNYGTTLYWSSQLFTREWDDSPARVIEDPS